MYQFHNENREISFDSYNTPTPWMNYLSNGTLHAMISQAGGGVAWYKSPQIWRINHYRFFHLPTDRSGFYTYIKATATTISSPPRAGSRSRASTQTTTSGWSWTPATSFCRWSCRKQRARSAIRRAVCLFVEYLRPGERQIRPGQRLVADRNGGMDVSGRNAVSAGRPPNVGRP